MDRRMDGWMDGWIDGCYGLEVLELKRIKIGNLELPKELEEGSCRELTQEELNSITEKEEIA